MKEKIEWYQEVLELEPGSKVFFPLARLLADSEQLDKAVHILRHGLDRHPEFIEARLYLIDLLFRHGRMDQCEEQVGHLSPLFSRYEGFWQAWGSSMAATGKEGDAGLALKFMAASFQQHSLSLSDVLSRGLEAMLQDQGNALKAISEHALPQAPRGPVPSATASVARSPLAEFTQPFPTEPPVTSSQQSHDGGGKDARSGMQDNALNGHNTLESMPERVALASASSAGHALASMDMQEESDEGEERFSLRTRSMAEVLAEQGDYAGALEIYQELSSQAVSPEEAADLQYRISTLTAHLGTVQEPAPAPEPVTSPGKHRVLTVLEALAERLESRVHG